MTSTAERVATPAGSELDAVAGALIARGEGAAQQARDPVNLPTIKSWLDALGDHNPIYTDEAAARAAGHPGIVAPPAMLQVWTMPGLVRNPDTDNPFAEMLRALDDAGYTSVIATNSDQTYRRYLRLGERPTVRNRLESVVGPKATAMGEGYFVTTRYTWRVGDEIIGETLFRVLKFRPPEKKPEKKQEKQPYPLRPVVNRDTEFFWAGAKVGELRIQRCRSCRRLRHPAGPMCPHCQSCEHDHVVATGHGTVHSYAVHHHPPIPGKPAPFVVALVELPEGVRVIGNLTAAEPRIGLPVEVHFEAVDDELTLPCWRERRE